MSAWTSRHDKHEAMQIIGAVGIPAGTVLDTKELAEDRTFHDRGILQTMDHPQIKGYVMPTWPVPYDGTPVAVRAAPMLAQHSTRYWRAGWASAGSKAWRRIGSSRSETLKWCRLQGDDRIGGERRRLLPLWSN